MLFRQHSSLIPSGACRAPIDSSPRETFALHFFVTITTPSIQVLQEMKHFMHRLLSPLLPLMVLLLLWTAATGCFPATEQAEPPSPGETTTGATAGKEQSSVGEATQDATRMAAPGANSSASGQPGCRTGRSIILRRRRKPPHPRLIQPENNPPAIGRKRKRLHRPTPARQPRRHTGFRHL